MTRHQSAPPSGKRTQHKTSFEIRRLCEIRWRFVDILALGYMAVIGLTLPFFHHHVPFWPRDVLIHFLFVAMALAILCLAGKYPALKTLRFLRTFYPLAIIFYGYFEMNHMNRMFCGSYWAMDLLVAADQMIFGVSPTVWVQQFYTPWRDELMNAFYASYYSFAPLATLPLFLRGKQEQTLAVFGMVTFSYLGNFVLFYAFPALCPRMIPELEAMRTADFTGYYAAALVKYFQSQGAISGGCFPSTHVSGAMAWALATWRYNRKLSFLLLPMALGVALATVYLGYHHALDPIVGLLWAFCAYPITRAFLRSRNEDPKP